MADCSVEIANLPLLTGCPGDNETFLVMGAVGGQGSGGYGRRMWSAIKDCQFGTGILQINGTNLDGTNQYFNSDLVNNLVVYGNMINRWLVRDPNDPTYPASEWNYLTSGLNVVGIKILIPATFGPLDFFYIFPNPNGTT